MKRWLKTALGIAVAGGTLAASAAFAENVGAVSAINKVESTAALRLDKIAQSDTWAMPVVPAAIAPYCANTYTSGVEPITLVKINEINNPSPATSSTAHEDFTATVGTLRPGATYAVTMKSNTGGAFTHGHALYVDWNGDGLFTGADEGYWIGTITNSTGVDALSATAYITVPATAVLGNTRLRAMTLYNSTALSGLPPCRTGSGYGQSEDYTVTIDPSAVVPTLPLTSTAGFTPASGAVPTNTTLAITIGNINTAPTPITADFITTLPAGMTLAANATTTCPGTFTGAFGGSAITLASGASIPVGGCAISSNVAVTAGGNYAVTAGPLTTAEGSASAVAKFFGWNSTPSTSYNVGFEAPDYAVGAINAQQAWSARTSNVATTAPATGTQHFSQTGLASPTTSTNPLAISPQFAVGTTRYAAVSAKLRISHTTNGASWQFQPQDADAGLLSTIILFNRTGNAIQAYSWSGGSGSAVSTGATFTPDTYFDFKLLIDRATSNVRLCKDGVQIFDSTDGTGTTGGNNVSNMVFQQATGSGQTANNTFFADDLKISYTASYECDGTMLPLHTVTPSVTGNGSISPNTVQTVSDGATPTFTLAATAGNHLVDVTGTCGGTLAGSSYTTAPVTTDCTVIANFAADVVTHTVTPSVGTPSGTITPAAAQTVNHGSTTSFTLAAAGGFHVANVGGTCGGSLAGNVYTTSAVNADCTVIANFAADVVTHTVTPSVGTPSGTITPATAQTVNHGATTSFTLAAASGFRVDTVGGTCGGALAGNVYTTNTVNADCTVIANFAADSVGSDLVCSAPINHTTLANGNGSYYNWITGAIVDDGASGPPGFHFNPYGSSKLSFFWGSNTKNAGVANTTTGTDWKVLQVGASVGPTSTFSRGVGNATNWIAGDTDGFLGFSMDCSTLSPAPASGTCYGYAHMTATGTTGIPSKLVDYCYDKAGNAITIAPAGPVAPTVSKSFAPAVVVVNADSTATITLSNANAAVATLSANLVDTLPTGLVASSATTTCGGTASFTAGTVTLGSGATIPASGSCTISATVRSATVGSYVNTIAAGALQTDKGNNGAVASATLGVTTATLNPPTIAKAFAPASVPVNTDSTATITLTNPNASAITLGADLVDTLPSGLVASAAATTCGGTASFTAGTLKLRTGATIPAGASCTLTGTVQSATVGSYVNTIAAGALQTNAGNNAAAASATLTVTTAAFPAPYCAMTFPSNVEPITRVKFTGIDNTSSAALNGSPALENFLSVAGGTVSRGGVYSMAVEGNTDGNFTTKIKVYIDWNHNGVFDADESYVIGDLANSTGTDGKQAVADIAVPAGALVGPTRMRVTKRFSAAAAACETTGFGQGEDYTLTVDSLPPPLPNANVTPGTLSLTAEQNASATGTMTVSNSGPGRLTFNVQRALAERQAAAAKQVDDVAARRQNDMQKLAMSGEVPLREAVDLLTASKGYLPQVGAPGMLASDPACDVSVPGIIVHDHDGIPDNGFGWNASAGSTARIVDKFTPTTYPGKFKTACLSLLTNAGVTSAAVKIVVYADDGAGGAPGTQLGSISATANNIGTGLVAQFQAFDISSMNLSIASGSVYIGVEWDAASITGLFLGVDTTSATSANGYQYTTAWAPIVDTRPTYRSMYIRAVQGESGAPGVGCDAPSNVPWLSTTPSSGTINGVGSMNVTVKANATGMAVGSYNAQLCVNTNDAAHPRFEIPVSFTVNPVAPPDVIFKDGFDGAGSSNVVDSGVLNLDIPSTIDGRYLNWLTGANCTSGCNDPDFHFDPYGTPVGAEVIHLWWPNAAGGNEGGVGSAATSMYSILASGATIGPSSEFITAAGNPPADMSNWAAGANGYLGFKFDCAAAGGVCYGYINLTTTAPNGFPAKIVRYWYDSSGAAITIP